MLCCVMLCFVMLHYIILYYIMGHRLECRPRRQELQGLEQQMLERRERADAASLLAKKTH